MSYQAPDPARCKNLTPATGISRRCILEEQTHGLPHYLGNTGHPATLLHEELYLRDGFRHSLRIHLSSRQRSAAILLSFTANSCFSSVSLTIHSLASPGPTATILGKLRHSGSLENHSRSQ